MKKRFLCLVTALILITLTACFKEPEVPKITDNADLPETSEADHLPEEAKKQLDSLYDADLGGRDFRIAADDASLIMPPNSTNLINRRIYERNLAIEKKYNVHLVLTPESGTSAVYSRIRTEALAGASYCDMVLLQSDRIQLLAEEALLFDLNTVPYLDLAAPYYNSSATESMTIGGFTYAAFGDLTYDPGNAFVLYFNQNLLSEAGLPDLYSLVLNGQWDMDAFLLYCEEVYSMDRSNDVKVYGYSSPYSKEEMMNVFWAAGGMPFMTTSGTPKLVYNTPQTQTWLELTREILFRSPTAFASSNTAIETFKLGRSSFCLARLSDLDSMVTEDFEWGVVPIPKFDVNLPNYHSYIGTEYQLAAFPKGIPDLSFAGTVANALFAASYQTSVNYYLLRILNTVIPNESCGYSVKNAILTPYFDSAFFFGKIYTPVSSSTYTLLYRVMSANDSFDRLFEQYSQYFEEFLAENHF